jgi:hypothetical protein
MAVPSMDEGRKRVLAIVAGTPAVQLVHFRVLGPPFCGAEGRAGAMGWGRSLSKFGPSIKMMRSP